MANSKHSYVKLYEQPDALLPNTYLVIRIDGKAFHAFSKLHDFVKPNDKRALQLMNAAAKRTMESSSLDDQILLAFGESDEFSFLLGRSCSLWKRRASKILTTVLSIFTSSYVMLWPTFFPESPLSPDHEGPSFDGRIIQYPQEQQIIDYFKWRQVDTHINNLYNTTFWALVQQGGMSTKEAHAELAGTVSAQKNEILFSRFQINYNNEDLMFRRGSLLARVPPTETLEKLTIEDGEGRKKREQKQKVPVVVFHDDVMKDSWWEGELARAILLR